MLHHAGGASPSRARADARLGTSSSRIGAAGSVLDSVLDVGVDIAVWQRSLPEGVADALTAWAHRAEASFEAIQDPARLDLRRAAAGLDDERVHAWLLADAAGLVARLAALAGPGPLKISLGSVRDDQCRRFHVDYLRLRLVTTYAGPGTQWLPEEAVDRHALEHAIDCSPWEANERIARAPNAVRHARAGDVLVMRGSRFPGVEPRRGAVHRSPPLDGTGQARVVLIVSTVDPVE